MPVTTFLTGASCAKINWLGCLCGYFHGRLASISLARMTQPNDLTHSPKATCEYLPMDRRNHQAVHAIVRPYFPLPPSKDVVNLHRLYAAHPVGVVVVLARSFFSAVSCETRNLSPREWKARDKRQLTRHAFVCASVHGRREKGGGGGAREFVMALKCVTLSPPIP